MRRGIGAARVRKRKKSNSPFQRRVHLVLAAGVLHERKTPNVDRNLIGACCSVVLLYVGKRRAKTLGKVCYKISGVNSIIRAWRCSLFQARMQSRKLDTDLAGWFCVFDLITTENPARGTNFAACRLRSSTDCSTHNLKERITINTFGGNSCASQNEIKANTV